MALPIEIFAILICAGILTLMLGIKNIAKDNGVSFILFSGLIFIITGLFSWTNGLQLTTVESWVSSGASFIPTYITLTAETASVLWVISYGLIVGGFITILIALGNTAGLIKFNKMEELYYREDFF